MIGQSWRDEALCAQTDPEASAAGKGRRPFAKALDLGRWDCPAFRDRFWSKVDRRGPEECWPWIASYNNRGYGQFFLEERRPETAPRVAYVLTHGPLAARQVVRHSCDNPPCCNPAHLLSGTQSENARDMVERGRANRSHGERHRDRRLTEEQVRAIRSRSFRYGEMTALARELGVSLTCIRRVRAGRTWRHVT